MKILKFIILILYSLIVNNSLFSQDTNLVKFFPLKVGNLWVYNGYKSTFGQCSTGYLKKVSIDSSITVNNKIYFKFNISTRFISGNGTCNYTYLYNGYFYRVDSLSGNIYMLYPNSNCSFNPSEVVFDSLKSRVNDTTFICSGGSFFKKILLDTVITQVFGFQKSSRNFREANQLEYAASCRFTKDFGVTYFDEYGMSSSSQNWIRGCILNGVLFGDTNYYLVSLHQISSEIPKGFSLSQNYPNPFNPSTIIKFAISGVSVAQTFLSVYDILGNEVAVLVNQNLHPGEYQVEWNASSFPSGVYYYKLQAGEYSETKKMVLIK